MKCSTRFTLNGLVLAAVIASSGSAIAAMECDIQTPCSVADVKYVESLLASCQALRADDPRPAHPELSEKAWCVLGGIAAFGLFVWAGVAIYRERRSTELQRIKAVLDLAREIVKPKAPPKPEEPPPDPYASLKELTDTFKRMATDKIILGLVNAIVEASRQSERAP